jgi:hypothetical protein
MLFIDYSSAFNTIVSSKLVTKLRTGSEHLPLQLDPGHPDGLTPGGEGRQHCLFPLRSLKKFGMGPQILKRLTAVPLRAY